MQSAESHMANKGTGCKVQSHTWQTKGQGAKCRVTHGKQRDRVQSAESHMTNKGVGCKVQSDTWQTKVQGAKGQSHT